jgi:hypothetical protein
MQAQAIFSKKLVSTTFLPRHDFLKAKRAEAIKELEKKLELKKEYCNHNPTGMPRSSKLYESSAGLKWSDKKRASILG